MKLQVVDFREQQFNAIPEQDNPAYSDKECILICKAEDKQTACYVVMKINEGQSNIDEIQQLGLFWAIESAFLFAKLIKPKKQQLMPKDKITWSNAGWWQLPLR